jgi:hypothetical protein
MERYTINDWFVSGTNKFFTRWWYEDDSSREIYGLFDDNDRFYLLFNQLISLGFSLGPLSISGNPVID